MKPDFNAEPVSRSFAEGVGDEGGLRAPPGLTGWRKAWWWFDFIILVKLARLRFIVVLAAIGIVITQWDMLAAYWDKWTRPTAQVHGKGDFEWYCPMHPTIVRDNAKDKCPICFMPLSKRRIGEKREEPLPAGTVNRVQLSPYRVVLAGIQTWPVDYQPLTKQINAVGYVEFNERGQRTVAARVKGRIDQLFVNETGRMVEKGDVLASLYSPDLVVSVQNLLDAKRAGDERNQASARRRLQLLGISDDQLDEIISSDTANTHLNIRSPISGHIIKKYVREGQYVEEGMPLYDIADLSTVWIQGQVYEDDIVFLPVDETESPHEERTEPKHIPVIATTRAFPNEAFLGELAFVYPHVDQNTRTVVVRFEVKNPGHKLRPGTTATVTLTVLPKDVGIFSEIAAENTEEHKKLLEGLVLAVPESSIIDTGSQKIVYRESSPGVYEGVQVKLGPRMEDKDSVPFFPVLRGLKRGDRVVTAGSFLVDAETRLNPAAGSIYFGGSGSKGAGGATVVRPSTPEDPEAKIKIALGELSPEDRALAEAQKQCPVLGTDLGAMGAPVKVMVEGQAVLLCCAACKEKALANPQAILSRVAELKKSPKAKPASNAERSDEPVVRPPSPKKEGSAMADPDAEIRAALSELNPADRKIAEVQRFCAVLRGSRLGSMGKPVKIVVDGEMVFVCCEGCEADAREKSAQAIDTAKRLRKLHRREADAQP